MSLKFHGTLQELKDKLIPLNLIGEWESQPNGVWKLKCRDKAGLLWSETKGTLWFDGGLPARTALEARVAALLSSGEAVPPIVQTTGTIFVVHGRDHDARDQLELILRRLGLEPFVLQVTGGGGDTLIEALERQIGKTAEASFGIVLATPDDMGYLGEDGPTDAKARARQNVIMEMGMLLASLTRKRNSETLCDLAKGVCGTSVQYGRRHHNSLQFPRSRGSAEISPAASRGRI
jgi:hypothetical protein